MNAKSALEEAEYRLSKIMNNGAIEEPEVNPWNEAMDAATGQDHRLNN